MSSILDALKKVEQESAADREVKTPWPPPPSTTTPERGRRGRWWLPLGLFIIVSICTAVFWLTHRPQTHMTAEVDRFAVPPAAKVPKAAPVPLPEIAPPPRTAPAPPPLAEAPAAPTPTPDTLPSAAPTAEPPPEAPLPVPQSSPSPVPLSSTEAPQPSPETVSRAESAVARESSPVEEKTVADEEIKNFRSDPRIELQALVWAPAAADRFVVINNRLIKEGGSIDDIEVIEINRDDVLLGEGTQRWHQAFKIR